VHEKPHKPNAEELDIEEEEEGKEKGPGF